MITLLVLCFRFIHIEELKFLQKLINFWRPRLKLIICLQIFWTNRAIKQIFNVFIQTSLILLTLILIQFIFLFFLYLTIFIILFYLLIFILLTIFEFFFFFMLFLLFLYLILFLYFLLIQLFEPLLFIS